MGNQSYLQFLHSCFSNLCRVISGTVRTNGVNIKGMDNFRRGINSHIEAGAKTGSAGLNEFKNQFNTPCTFWGW
jgi:hypothetical protein